MQAKIVEQIFERLGANIANPETELQYTNNFTLLIAVVLSAQSTDIMVNRATKDLFAYYDTPKKMLECGIDRLKEYIKIIGLYNSKAVNIIKICQILIEQHNSQVPDKFDDLIKLPGVGVKTANVILNCAFNQPTIAVDTHVFRVARRLGLSNSDKHEQVGVELMRIVPKQWLKSAHHLMVLHGRYVCKARNPSCSNCCIREYCSYYNLDR